MKKKVLAVLLGGCMVVGMLAGCGSKADDTKKADGDTKTEGSGDSKGYHFEVVVKSFQSSYWQAAVQGINQACDELRHRNLPAASRPSDPTATAPVPAPIARLPAPDRARSGARRGCPDPAPGPRARRVRRAGRRPDR